MFNDSAVLRHLSSQGLERTDSGNAGSPRIREDLNVWSLSIELFDGSLRQVRVGNVEVYEARAPSAFCDEHAKDVIGERCLASEAKKRDGSKQSQGKRRANMFVPDLTRKIPQFDFASRLWLLERTTPIVNLHPGGAVVLTLDAER